MNKTIVRDGMRERERGRNDAAAAASLFSQFDIGESRRTADTRNH